MRSRLLALALLLTAARPAPGAGPDPRLDGYRTPPGWHLAIAADAPQVVNPVAMTFGPDGRLYVIEWAPGGGAQDRIRVLTDADHDGTFERADVFLDGLDRPAGLAFWDGWTYLSLPREVVRRKDGDGDGTFEGREVLVRGFEADDAHHRVSGLTIGPDGWLYIATGGSDTRAEGTDGSRATLLRNGGLLRCRPDGTGLEVVARGMLNPWGNVAFDDEFNIFHTDNDAEDTPGFAGCRLLHVVEGGDYGWRLREGARGGRPDPDRATWRGGRPGRLGPVAETGRGAPAGLCTLNSLAFPPSLRNRLVAPDIVRQSVRAFRLRPAGASFAVASEIDVLAAEDPRFRPADAEVGPDGALYVLDRRTDARGADPSGRIYRLSWSGTAEEPARPPLSVDRLARVRAGDERALIADLSSRDFAIRDAATLELIRRGVGEPGALEALAGDTRARTPGRRHALAVLHAARPREGVDPALLADARRRAEFDAAIDEDPAIRRAGMAVLGRAADPADADLALTVLSDLRFEDDPATLRATALALGRFSGLRRARPGENVSYEITFDHLVRDLGIRDNVEVLRETSDALRNRLLRALTADMLAQSILNAAVALPDPDPVLLDGVARGLERLGPAGVDALVAAALTDSPRRADAALAALQALREPVAQPALLDLATGPDPIPPAARAGLFRALREFAPDVPAAPIARWLSSPAADAPDLAEARAAALRLRAALGES